MRAVKGHADGKTKTAARTAAKAASTPTLPSTYNDGAALDRVQYLEAKLILKPDRFTSVKSFRDFGKIVQRTARKLGVGFTEDKKASVRPEVREILFLDTPDFALYSNAFILRRRISYVDGFAEGDPEIVFKFRHPNEAAAAALDVRPDIDGDYRIKFKAEALPLKDEIGGYRILYSHNCQFGLSQTHDKDKTSMETLHRVFPALTMLKKSGKERVSLVNGGIVEEVLLHLGTLNFGRGLKAKCDVSLWRTRGEHRSLVGEFAFQAKFDRKEDIAQQQRKIASQFYVTLQREVADWLALGVTKTAMVYRLNGAEPQSHE
ncbi:MAG: hypothetical protein M9937_22650 [Chelatococcus sp.]|nr:hypothetical protein [Chelatococcus sp.]CAH1654731.1 conserved hypothetical protein [Hyphomicrobiales bacterium]CAH1685330.1 conserved hypothetical protein [Hyphomicrobiales bacterium]